MSNVTSPDMPLSSSNRRYVDSFLSETGMNLQDLACDANSEYTKWVEVEGQSDIYFTVSVTGKGHSPLVRFRKFSTLHVDTRR